PAGKDRHLQHQVPVEPPGLLPIEKAVARQRVAEAPGEELPIPHVTNSSIAPHTLDQLGHRLWFHRGRDDNAAASRSSSSHAARSKRPDRGPRSPRPGGAPPFHPVPPLPRGRPPPRILPGPLPQSPPPPPVPRPPTHRLGGAEGTPSQRSQSDRREKSGIEV